MARQAKARSAQLPGRRRLAGGQGPARRVVAGRVDPVRHLHQDAAADLLDLGRRRTPGRRHEHPQVLLLAQHLDRLGGVGRRHDHLGEDLRDLLGQLGGDLLVDRDHPAERGHRVTGVRLAVRLGHVRADRDAARVGVLDDRHARLGEVVGAAPGGVRVDVVVVGHLLAVQLLGLGQAGRRGRVDVERGLLVRVLAVAQRVLALAAPARRTPATRLGASVVAHQLATATSYSAMSAKARAASSLRCVSEKPPSVRACRISGYAVTAVTTATEGWFLAAARTIAGPPMSICSTHSSTLAPEATVSVNGYRFETSRSNGSMPSSASCACVRVQPQVGEQAGVHLGVQRLDPAVQRLREPGQLLDPGHRHAGGLDGGRGGAGGDRSGPRRRAGPGPARRGRSCRTR